MILFGILNTDARFYVNVCPGLGYVLTDVPMFAEWANSEDGDLINHNYFHEGSTQAGFKFPVKVGQRLGLMKLIRCYVQPFNGTREAGGKFAERFFMGLYPLSEIRKATLEEEYRDIDCFIDGVPYQVKLDTGIKKYGNVYLEVAKRGVKYWANKEVKNGRRL